MSEAKPKIFIFSNVKGGGDGVCYAMAEDGTVLGSHWCSCEAWAWNDLGGREGSRPDRHEHYRKHYPQGYEMEFVPHGDVSTHPGLVRAFELNQKQAEANHPTKEPSE